MFNKEVYTNRRNKLKATMKQGVALFLGNKEASYNYASNEYTFRQDSSFLYFFGIKHADFVGLIDLDEGKDYIFANDMDIADIIWMGHLPTVKQLASEVGVENTGSLADLSSFINAAIAKGRQIHYLPTYRAATTVQMSNLLGIRYDSVKKYASVELIKEMVKLRSIKEEIEIVEIENAISTAYDMHTTAMRMAKVGMLEQEIVGKMEGIASSAGGPVSFPIILTINGQTLHNHYHGNRLQEGRMLVVDAGSENGNNYCSDITRTLPVGGKFNQRQKDIYEAVLSANLEATQMMKPGIFYRDVHLHAAKVMATRLKDLGLMKGNIDDAVAAGAHAMFFPHGLGHMMGLDVHDMESYGENFVGYNDEIQRSQQFGTAYLRLGRRLETGFVLTNEPGLYFIPALIDKWRAEKINAEFINFDKAETYKDFGGIRIEDDILITKDAARVLGKPIPKTVAEIEQIMNE